MVSCSKCFSEAITYIRYNGSHLCPDHFTEFVERRVKKEIRRQLEMGKHKQIGVAVSGGKDSSVALQLLSEILGSRRDVSISAISVDEGIAGYRSESLEKVKELCRSLKIPLTIVSFKDEVGLEMDEVSRYLGPRTPCAYCGVLRRRCLNKAAKEIGAEVLATGLNLDDTSQAILMNFTRGDVERLARLGPHEKVQPGLIPRIQPLRSIPEKESYLYALVRGIDFSDGVCPYYQRALRNQYREMLDEMETRTPGTKFSILSSYDAIGPLIREKYSPAKLNSCECGEPTLGGRCMSCKLLDELKKRMRGEEP